MSEPSLEIAKLVYENIREEILEKMKFSNQLLGYKLLSIGAVLGLVASNKVIFDDAYLKTACLFVAASLAICFDLALYQNNKAIILAGSYIKENIEPWLIRISDSQVVMWEDYITRNSSKKKKRMIYNIFESANYIMSLFLILVGLVGLWLSSPKLILALLPLLAVELMILSKGLSRV
jgi:hypothetical protein